MITNKIVVFGNTLQNTMGLIRSLGKRGYVVDLLLEPCSKSQCFVRFSKYLGKVHYLSRMDEAIDVLIREYGKEASRTILFCGSDPTISLLDANYDKLKDRFIVFNANGEQGRINRFLDKNCTFEIAEKCGLNLIRTWYVDDKNNVPLDITYPCFVKGNNSVKSGKWDIKICTTREELLSFLREGVSYLIQEYIRKDGEYSLTGASFDHGQKVCLTGVIKKIREDLVRMGEFMRLDEKSQYPEINFDGIVRLVREIGYEGIFSVDLLRKGNRYYFLEINLRNDGLAYMYTAAGANYPDLWVKYVTGTLADMELRNVSIKTPFYVMHENDLYNIVEGKIGLFRWVKDFLRTDAFFILDIKDPMPFVYSCWIHCKQLMKKVVKQLLGIKIK